MQQGTFNSIDILGKKLSLIIGCPVTWPGYDKNIFVCRCGISFHVYRLQGSDDWSWAKEEHGRPRNDQGLY